MESENTSDEVTATSPLLPPDVGGGERRSSSDSATLVLVLSTFVAVAGSYVFGSAVGYSSPAQSGILEDLGLTLAEYSLFGSISTIGAMVGAIVSGKIADLFGRRGAMGFAELFNIVGWVAIAFSKNAWWLDIGRLSTGFGVGLLSYVVPVYIAEITPKNLRGAFTAVNQLMICCGVSVMYLVGNFINWRVLALIGTIPCLIQIVGLFLIPESPRWLAKMGKWDGSRASLVRLRGKNANIFEEAAEISDYTRMLEQLKDSRIMDLFQRKYAHSLIVGVGLMVLQQFGGVNAIAYYASAVFSSAGFSYRVGTTTMVIVQVPMTVLGTLLMDKSGRRPLLLVSVTGTCLGCFLIGLSYYLQDHKLWDSSPSLAFGGVLLFSASFSLGLGGIPWVIMSEIFPINVKGLAGSLVTVINWFGTWIITYSFNFLAQWSSAGTFFVFAIISGLTIVFIIKLVPKTKGRTLEEIQASMIAFGAAK
ncbi:putative transporter (major facilitator superfamily) [Handroanthus impetiginosus]|uniref:Putative transporter (Major facilitator superfamily) n=1 Tax=Handroanthus impetiginosus TaxID=429701 RepID=A0A2G9GTL0_9LAMI|nr:putative transporter (major facilitator superfamily) [Handroanthus impetiginosus]